VARAKQQGPLHGRRDGNMGEGFEVEKEESEGATRPAGTSRALLDASTRSAVRWRV